MRVGYVGNFEPTHSTENHLTLALRSHGHDVIPLQENHEATWTTLLDPEPLGLDFVLWTRTWHLPEFPQSEALSALDEHDVPTVAYHLDRWWGLDREHQVETEPYFGCDVVCTAEGGVPDLWAHAGVRHEWYPPGVLGSLATVGRPNRRWFCDVAFVGSHRSYHVEWPWRARMTRWLRQTYRGRVRLFPQHPSQAVRGEPLADLYASTKVVVGDSCLAPYPALDYTGEMIPAAVPCSRYWSDRVPETLGRAGFLLHPWVEGIEDHFTDGEHLVLVEPESFESLSKAIDWWTDDAHRAERDRIRHAGRAHVLEHHTYEQRMAGIVELLIDHGRVAA
jgi:hypothetical protein